MADLSELREQLLTTIAKSNMRPNEILDVLNEVKSIINTVGNGQPKEDSLASEIAKSLHNLQGEDNIQIDIIPVDAANLPTLFCKLADIRNDLIIINELL